MNFSAIDTEDCRHNKTQELLARVARKQPTNARDPHGTLTLQKALNGWVEGYNKQAEFLERPTIPAEYADIDWIYHRERARLFDFYAVETLRSWQNKTWRNPDSRNFTFDLASTGSSDAEQWCAAQDCGRAYEMHHGVHSSLLDDTQTAKAIYIGGMEYICRNVLDINQETGSMSITLNKVSITDPLGVTNTFTYDEEYFVSAAKVRRDMNLPADCAQWPEFVEKKLLRRHMDNFGFIRSFDYHMDRIESYVLGTIVSEKADAEESAADRKRFYEENAAILF